jgi:hypothetical protein
LAGHDPATASRADLLRAFNHWKPRAIRSETVAGAALDFIAHDNEADTNRDDRTNRCAHWSADDAASLGAWTARVNPPATSGDGQHGGRH